MNKPPYSLVAVLGLTLTTATAQTRLSLTEALEMGVKNRYDLQATQLNRELNANTFDKQRGTYLPTLTASGNVRYNTQLQTTAIPAGAFPGVNEARRLTLGLRNSTIFALDLTQPLYQPTNRTELALVRNDGALQREKDGQQQTNAKVRIAEAYLNVLLKDIQRGIARADEGRYGAYFGVSEGKYKLGTLLERDYLNARLDLQNSQLTAQKAEQDYRSAQAKLCYELNIPTDTTLVLTDRIDSTSVVDPRLPVASTGMLAPNRTELRQLDLQLENYSLQSQKVRDALKPSVSFYGNYSTQFLANDFDYFSNNWFPFNYLGGQLSVPLTGQFTKRTNLKTYQLQASQTQLTRQQTEADITNEVRQAGADLSNAVRNWQSTQASLTVSRQLNQLQQDQYRLGTLLYTQVLDTEKSLQTAEQNYIEAVYNYLVAKLNYDKAMGLY